MKMTVPDLKNIWITARTRGIIVESFAHVLSFGAVGLVDGL